MTACIPEWCSHLQARRLLEWILVLLTLLSFSAFAWLHVQHVA